MVTTRGSNFDANTYCRRVTIQCNSTLCWPGPRKGRQLGSHSCRRVGADVYPREDRCLHDRSPGIAGIAGKEDRRCSGQHYCRQALVPVFLLPDQLTDRSRLIPELGEFPKVSLQSIVLFLRNLPHAGRQDLRP